MCREPYLSVGLCIGSLVCRERYMAGALFIGWPVYWQPCLSGTLCVGSPVYREPTHILNIGQVPVVDQTYHLALMHSRDVTDEVQFVLSSSTDSLKSETSTPCNKLPNNSVTELKNLKYLVNMTDCPSLNPESKGVSRSGIKFVVRSDASLQVVQKAARGGRDSFVAIPDSQLGTEYYIGTYYLQGGVCQLAVTPTQSDTLVTIFLPDGLDESFTCQIGSPVYDYVHGKGFRFVLHEFEVFHYQGNRDLSGTFIVSNNTVSVIVGSKYYSSENTGLLVQQIPPTISWGSEFVILPNPDNDQGDIVKIVPKYDSTRVYITGHSPFIIPKAGLGVERRIDRGMNSVIRSSLPILVLQEKTDAVFAYIYNEDTAVAPFGVTWTQTEQISCHIWPPVPGDLVDNDCDCEIDEDVCSEEDMVQEFFIESSDTELKIVKIEGWATIPFTVIRKPESVIPNERTGSFWPINITTEAMNLTLNIIRGNDNTPPLTYADKTTTLQHDATAKYLVASTLIGSANYSFKCFNILEAYPAFAYVCGPGNNICRHVQIPPRETLGKVHYIPQLALLGDTVTDAGIMILATEDSTVVTIWENYTSTIYANLQLSADVHSQQIKLNTTYKIEATKSVHVILLLNIQTSVRQLVNVPSIDQYRPMQELTFTDSQTHPNNWTGISKNGIIYDMPPALVPICKVSRQIPGDGEDNDCDGLVDEETRSITLALDLDIDGAIQEDCHGNDANTTTKTLTCTDTTFNSANVTVNSSDILVKNVTAVEPDVPPPSSHPNQPNITIYQSVLTIRNRGTVNETCLISCMCPCSWLEPPKDNPAQIAAKVKALQDKLRVDKKGLSATLRKLHSAPDGRRSATAIGAVGIGFIVAAIGCLFLLDLPNIFRDLRRLRENVAHLFPF
ncbi:hypothetical protein MAR_030385 [Mya arenaria]|uniref:IgGFc-binding protein N-terminal domain-containing protein n=1 Tax=Mya arenaria TaxID=6604 RepID=A0ABY7F918_MYAAR|nr:hypothetical protein MAR_030385 [Mya arenaria]